MTKSQFWQKVKKSVFAESRNEIIGINLTQDFSYRKLWALCSHNFSCYSRKKATKYTMMHFEALLSGDDLSTGLLITRNFVNSVQ
jgi:hypothetical protein